MSRASKKAPSCDVIKRLVNVYGLRFPFSPRSVLEGSHRMFVDAEELASGWPARVRLPREAVRISNEIQTRE